MWVVELFEKLRWVLNTIDTKVEMVDVLIARPGPRRFVRRISAIGGQREIRFAADNRRGGRRRGFGGRTRRARANHIEAKDRGNDRQIDRCGCEIASQ